MKILTSNTKLQIVLGAAKTTNDFDCVVDYRDITETTFTPAQSLTNSNGLTDADMLAAPASGHQYIIDGISIYNRDTILHTVTIKLDVGGTEKIIWRGDVAAGALLEWIEGYGWKYLPPSPQGYVINLQALTSSPADTTPFYFGYKPSAITTTAGQNKIYVRKAGTLKIAEIYTYAGTAGTAEAVSMYVRVNNTTDYLIATVAVAANERRFSNNALNIPLADGDYFEIKCIPPVWATNPLTFICGGYVYIE